MNNTKLKKTNWSFALLLLEQDRSTRVYDANTALESSSGQENTDGKTIIVQWKTSILENQQMLVFAHHFSINQRSVSF